jgi:predicted MFS family arabinose efflux permease
MPSRPTLLFRAAQTGSVAAAGEYERDEGNLDDREARVPLWVVFGLAMGPAVALGLGRFAYALLLPAMRADLGWNFTQAGALNTANAVGYLAGAVIAAPVATRMGEKLLFAISLLFSGVAVAVTGLAGDFSTLLSLRVVAGFIGALAFISGAGLVAAAATGGPESRAPTLFGIYSAGAGIGITASALAVPSLLGTVGWRGGWLVLGALAIAATAFGCLALPRCRAPARAAAPSARSGWSPGAMAHNLLAYGIFGAGYIAYATFIIAFLRGNEGFSAARISLFWSILGMASVGAAFLWSPILRRLSGGSGTAATISVVVIGAATPLLWSRPAGAYLSAVLFGGSFLSVVAAVTALARRAARSHAWTAVIGVFTVAFGLGQCIGPVLSGALSDGPGGVRIGLWLSVGLLAVAGAIAVFQGEPTLAREAD